MAISQSTASRSYLRVGSVAVPVGGVGPVYSGLNICSGLWPPFLCACGFLSSLLMTWRAQGKEHGQRFPWTSTVGSIYSMQCMEEKCSWGVCSQPKHTEDVRRARRSSWCTWAMTKLVNETALLHTPQLSCWLHNPILFFITLNRLDCLIDM